MHIDPLQQSAPATLLLARDHPSLQPGVPDIDDFWLMDEHSQLPKQQDFRVSAASVDFEFAASGDEAEKLSGRQSPLSQSSLGLPANRAQFRKPWVHASHNKGPRHSSPDIVANEQVHHNASPRFSIPAGTAGHSSPIARAKSRISEDSFDNPLSHADHRPTSTDAATRVKGSDSGLSEEKPHIMHVSHSAPASNPPQQSDETSAREPRSPAAGPSPIPSPSLPRFRQTKLSLVATANSTMI